jgi:hypothetical protein
MSPETTVKPLDPQDSRGVEGDFATVSAETTNGLKTADNASVSAAPNVLTDENGAIGGGEKETASRAAPQPNGSDAAAAPETPATAAENLAAISETPADAPVDDLTELERAIIEEARRHPSKSAAALAKHFGQPAWLVTELLDRARLSSAEEPDR